ncbi:hypothetical protein E3U43_006490 [Larimichthys crocea]|uniref:Uncharacterized protein n=1 Tax=Larimichthys crocea TaxID=215358 RepID=A0ACD3RKU9_LARCR|nr:hypothetical protein E3U43_006490 [Larimichthys crocea]
MHSVCLRFSDVTDVHTLTQCHRNMGWGGEIPSSLKHFNIYDQLSLHTTFLPCMMEHKKSRVRREGEHRVAHEEVKWDSISINVLSMDSAGFPVALSWPQCLRFFNV